MSNAEPIAEDTITMNTPSVKAIRSAFSQWLTRGQATTIKRIMNGPGKDESGQTRMQRIDRVLGTCGVEYVQRGRNDRSPGFVYCNAGDIYATTIVKVRGHFRITTIDDIIERGNYE